MHTYTNTQHSPNIGIDIHGHCTHNHTPQTNSIPRVQVPSPLEGETAPRPRRCYPFPRDGGKQTAPVLVLATLIAAFGSSFQYGYNVSVVNSPSQFMQQFYNTTYMERYHSPMEENVLTLLWSLSVSMFPLGGFFGSLMVAPLVNKFGRKGTLLFNNIFSIVPAIMMGVSEIAKSYEIIIVARFIVGICAGLSSNVVPMYLGEIAPKNLRGALGIVPQLFITVGILCAQVLGIRNILGNSWTLMLGLTGIPAAIQLLLLPFFPESPRYMLIQNGDEKKATKGKKVRCHQHKKSMVHKKITPNRLNVFCSFRPYSLISIVVMNMGQQLSGVNAVRRIYYYADSIYGSAGVRESDIQYVTVGTGAVNVFMTITVFIVEASGRRLLLLCGFGICCGACVLLTVALNLQVWYRPVSPIPYVVATEMFRQTARPAAFMVAGSVHWLSNFIVGLVFPFLEVSLGPYSFIIFAVICLVTLIYIWLVVPETKKKTFLEVFQMFAKRNKVELNLGDGDLPLKELKESPQDAQKATPF
uniref:Solute carrier family 2, facilitated glucose transporter member 5 n=1 Tax=Maylandia zebra TaxID=106582 RepID=A0A3P9BZD5_9CICH